VTLASALTVQAFAFKICDLGLGLDGSGRRLQDM